MAALISLSHKSHDVKTCKLILKLTPWSRESFWKAKSRSDSQETASLWNTKADCRVQRACLWYLPWAKLTHSTHWVPIFKINFNIFLQSTPRSSGWFLPFRIPYRNIVCISHFPCPIHIVLFDFIIVMISGKGLVVNSCVSGTSRHHEDGTGPCADTGVASQRCWRCIAFERRRSDCTEGAVAPCPQFPWHFWLQQRHTWDSHACLPFCKCCTGAQTSLHVTPALVSTVKIFYVFNGSYVTGFGRELLLFTWILFEIHFLVLSIYYWFGMCWN